MTGLHQRKTLLCACLLAFSLSASTQTDNVQLQIANLQSPDSAIRANAASSLGRFKDTRAIGPLLASLNDPQSSVRMAAVLSLSAFKDPRVVPPLIAVLSDPDKDVLRAAALSLGILRDPRAITALIRSLSTQRMAVSALTQMAHDAFPALINALHDDDSQVRAGAAETLGQIRNPAAVRPLVAATRDPVADVRTSAAVALTSFADPQAIDAVLAAVKDDDPRVREAVVRMLERVKDRRALNALIVATTDPNPSVQLSAYQALARSNDDRALRPVTKALNSTDPSIRATASLALSRAHNPKALPDLVSTYRNSTDQNLRIRALEGLGRQKDPLVTDLLIAALKDEDSGIRLTAANSLARIKDPRAVKPLANALADPDNSNKQPFYSALASIGPASFEPLEAMVEDSRTCPQAAGYLAATHDPKAAQVLLPLLDKLDFEPDRPGMISLGRAPTRADLDRAAASAHQVTGTCFFPAARGLIALHDARVIVPLVKCLHTPHSGRDQVPELLRHLGPLAIEPMLSLFHDPDPVTRRLAAETVSSMPDLKVHTALIAALHERNIPVLAGAYPFFIQLGESGSELALVEALQTYGDSGTMQMASYFLNCGNVDLEIAARAWATQRKFQLTQTMYGVTWGGIH